MRQQSEEKIAQRAIRGLCGGRKKQAKKRDDFVVVQRLTPGAVAKLGLYEVCDQIGTWVSSTIGNGCSEVLAEFG